MILDQDIEFLEHYGKKGMKWGVRKQASAKSAARERAKTPDRLGNRNNKQAQRKVDQYRRVASGKGTKVDSLILGAFKVPLIDIIGEGSLRGATQLKLDRDQRNKNKVNAGKARVIDKLNRAGGVDVRQLNFKYTA